MNLAANQETQIEDSSGERWSVTLKPVGDLLAFKNGWREFYRNHDLGYGQCLVFNYIKESHFVVQIYQRSGCEILNFNNVRPQENNARPPQKKRHKSDSETVSQDEPFQTPDVNSRKKHHSPPPVTSRSKPQNRQTHLAVRNADLARRQICSSSVTMDDPSWMIFRDDSYNNGEDRNFLYDLSSFEMEKETPDAKKIEKALDTVVSPSHTEFMEYANNFEIAAPCHTGTKEQTKTSEDVTDVAVIHTNPTDGPSGDVFTDRVEEALDTRMAPSHALTKTSEDNSGTAVIHTNQTYGSSDDDFSDKFEKMFTDVAPSSHTEIMEQSKTMENDTEMPVILSDQITGPSDDIFTEKSYAKPSNNGILSKGMSNDVPSLHDSKRTFTDLLGNKHVMALDSRSTFVGSSKIAEGAHAVKGWSFGSSLVSSPAPNGPYGSRAIKKERVEWGEEASAFAEVSYVVKVEPDLSDEVVRPVEVRPFSAEVKNLPYLELHIPPMPGRRDRGRGKVVYLRGSNGRLWPVLYPDVYSIKALTDNWTLFCRQNNIKPGDECRFQLEKDKDLLYIYKVDVKS
ncbi:hypothetical protein CDL12_06064 [Handroanthus impetiginosus]|uniref:TF-B3 domain-containing protein n=1 Tax=Handroanthus impetiginosus TaxID=429701 RepID=A0A2G9HUU5_9LAMI|nr:hypothetical protein CDL12_06064 [Handroanthus impetiginosus]